jgi:hypothetical protein
MGHSAIAWLGSIPGAHLYSFDLGSHDYIGNGSLFVDRLFPGRLTLTLGDSVASVPRFFRENPLVFCDIVHVDGGHTFEIAMADLENLGARLTENGLIFIDDTTCPHSFCVDKAWKQYLSKESKLSPLRIDLVNTLSGFSAAIVEQERD